MSEQDGKRYFILRRYDGEGEWRNDNLYPWPQLSFDAKGLEERVASLSEYDDVRIMELSLSSATVFEETKKTGTKKRPRVSETPGVDIIGGIDSAEYVRKIRDGSSFKVGTTDYSEEVEGGRLVRLCCANRNTRMLRANEFGEEIAGGSIPFVTMSHLLGRNPKPGEKFTLLIREMVEGESPERGW